MIEVVKNRIVSFEEDEVEIINKANIVVFHAKCHQPLYKIEGVNYVGSTDSINVQSASEMMNCESIALPITFNGGCYYAQRVNDYHQVIGVSMVSCDDIKEMLNNYRLSEREIKGFRELLAKINRFSYC